MKAKQVVTSFLKSEGKILILKRSGEVGTHQQRWAGVSGYLEKKEEPLARALKEIEEETGLTEDRVELLKASEPIGIPDPEIETLWIVYPHLFKTQSREIETDWEHTEHQWINPEDLAKYSAVPGLNETLQKVLPTPIDKITSAEKVIENVKMIESDRSHGASWLAREAVKTLVEASEAYELDNTEDYLTRLKLLAEHLMNLRPSMAPLNNQVGELLYRMVEKSKTTSNLDDMKRFVKSEAESLNRESEEAAKGISENVLKLIPKQATILTHSYSSTVIEALKLAHDRKKDIQVFVTESRPLFEGRTTAKELTEYGVPTTLVTDAAAGFFAGNARLVLLGADSLLADGSLINKVGTYPIVLAAAYQGIPVYVAAELSKVNLRSYFTRILLEEKDRSEVWSDGPDKISIRNLYFDITPKFFITGIVTESQRMRPDELLQICREIIKNRYIV